MKTLRFLPMFRVRNLIPLLTSALLVACEESVSPQASATGNSSSEDQVNQVDEVDDEAPGAES